MPKSTKQPKNKLKINAHNYIPSLLAWINEANYEALAYTLAFSTRKQIKSSLCSDLHSLIEIYLEAGLTTEQIEDSFAEVLATIISSGNHA